MNRIFGSILFVLVFILFGAIGCTKKAAPVKSTEKIATDYSDDLSKYRMRREALEVNNYSEGQETIQNEAITSEKDISSKLNIVLDSITSKNKALGYLQGYTILVYTGTSRTEADRVRNKLFDIVSDQDVPTLQHVLPTYFVKIGQFHEQIEGQSLYLKIRDHFPNSTIVPEKFQPKDVSKEGN